MRTTKHFNDVRKNRQTDRWETLIHLLIDYISLLFFRSATGLQQRSCTGTISTCAWRWLRSGWRWLTSAAACTITTLCSRSRLLSTAAQSSDSRRHGSKSPSRYGTTDSQQLWVTVDTFKGISLTQTVLCTHDLFIRVWIQHTYNPASRGAALLKDQDMDQPSTQSKTVTAYKAYRQHSGDRIWNQHNVIVLYANTT